MIDVEGAWYRYSYGITAANAATPAPPPAAWPIRASSDHIQVSYLLPQNICFCGLSGKLQPFARYQYYARDFKVQAAPLSTVGSPLFFEGTDIGVNWVISGYNARTTIAWGQRDAEGGSDLWFTAYWCSTPVLSKPTVTDKRLALAHGPEKIRRKCQG